MSDFNRGLTPPTSVVTDTSVDAGLRAFMLGVYNKVGLGLVLSAALAYVTGTVPQVQQFLFTRDQFGRVGLTILGMIVMWAPVAIILFQTFIRRTATPQSAALTYWAVVALFGASLGIWFLVYPVGNIVQTFLVTAIAFGGLSLVGYTTKRDLTGIGNFLIMGLFGLIFASLAMLFFHSPALAFAVNLIGVLIFAGLIAANTQQLKLIYHQVGGDTAAMNVATSYGALRLYLDFVNLFQFLLYFMGGSRR
jgi:FtsH-binding integral membrane protein